MNQRGSAHGTQVAHHVEPRFIRTYIFSTDHKMIGRQYLFYGLFMMILGGFWRCSCAGAFACGLSNQCWVLGGCLLKPRA